jgi:glutathione synthase/RimK-type ligase-like ATP-grasp enzyme
MKIAIHHSPESHSPYWIAYCEENNIAYKIVSCYANDIIEQLQDCDALMWHHNQVFPTDFLIAKQILYSLEMKGFVVYPNWRTGWHFDDKLGQKYLFEALNLPHVKYHAFYNKESAKHWLSSVQFPVVFKLRGGAGSKHVYLVKDSKQADQIVNKIFSKGIRQFNALGAIKDTYRLIKMKKASYKDLAKAIAHIFVPIKLEKSRGREKGYALFQDFVPNLKSDIRVQVVGDKCYAMERSVRENDFRASGSGKIDFDGSKLPKELIQLSFDITNKIQAQTIAFDFVLDGSEYKLIEVSYGWSIADGELEPGYWDSDLEWHNGKINPFGWMVEDVLKAIRSKNQ